MGPEKLGCLPVSIVANFLRPALLLTFGRVYGFLNKRSINMSSMSSMFFSYISISKNADA